MEHQNTFHVCGSEKLSHLSIPLNFSKLSYKKIVDIGRICKTKYSMVIFKAIAYCMMMPYVTMKGNGVESSGKLTCLIEGGTN